MKKLAILFLVILFGNYCHASDTARWVLDKAGIKWNVVSDKRLPHLDNIEMSGQLISAIITYGVDEQRNPMI